MFTSRYFNPRYWAARFWPKIGGILNAGDNDVDNLTIKSVNDLSVSSVTSELTIKSVNDLSITSI